MPMLPELTAVLLVAAIRTVLKAVAAEAADDAVDAAGTREEGRATFRLCFGCRRKRHTEGYVRRWSSLALWPPYPTHPECAKESFRFSMKSPRECNHPTTTCQTPNQHGHLQAAFSRAANHTASKVLTGTWEKAQAVRFLLHKHEDLILNPRNYTET